MKVKSTTCFEAFYKYNTTQLTQDQQYHTLVFYYLFNVFHYCWHVVVSVRSQYNANGRLYYTGKLNLVFFSFKLRNIVKII